LYCLILRRVGFGFGNPYPAAEKFGFNVKLMHLGQKFVDIVENPKYGRGKNMNVCVDCRILMLSEAKEFMELINADFIITGEVLGQRPMSQVKDKLFLTIKQAGLQGKLLRPLSAKLLPPSEPELNGLVDRELLEGISGRGRHRQLELANEFGLEDYPSPASGCLLTDVGYSNRLRDLVEHTGHLTFDDLNLLRVGRHFRLDENTKVVIGRNEKDNNLLDGYRRDYHYRLEALDCGSPVTLLIGNPTEDNLTKAATLTARYSSAKDENLVSVSISGPEIDTNIDISPKIGEENQTLQPVR
jgi:tRNA-specific 2-thiouridylase